MGGPRTMLTRDEAVVLLGVLVADADGKRSPPESEALKRRLQVARSLLHPDSLATVEAWNREARTAGAAPVLQSLGYALTEAADRLWALKTAVWIAYADHVLRDEEAEQIAAVARTLGVPPRDVERLARR